MKDKMLKALSKNWGELAESMQCNVEIRLHLDSCNWECFVYALNPDDMDTCLCIISTQRTVELCERSLKELCFCYDYEGQTVSIDPDFRIIPAIKLYEKLKKIKEVI